MTPDTVHILLVSVSFAMQLQVYRVSTLDCGTVNFVRPTVSGGSATIKGEWPFIVSIQKRSEYICGGTIISNKHILTAAHCIQNKQKEGILSPHSLTVRLGAYNLTKNNEQGAVQRNVSDIVIHPDWDPFVEQFDADIAILVLSENITFTDDIQPVCMPANEFKANMEGTVVGYGVRRKGIYAETPRRIMVRAVNSSHCFRETDIAGPYSSKRTFCGGNGDGSPDVGDSGSGYFFTPGFSWAQYGIVAVIHTDGTGHVFPHAYHIYTNLTMFKDWITKTVNETGGEVGEARITITMKCEYDNEAIIFADLQYCCSLHNIDIQGNNFDAASFNGQHLNDKTRNDVQGLHFVNGTMSYLPSGFGLFFENIEHLTVGGHMHDSESLGTKVVRRSDLRNLRRLTGLSFLRNDIETLHEDALWDLPNMLSIKFVENKLKLLYNETFSRNRRLMQVDFRSNHLNFLPANLFRNNPKISGVDFQKNFLKTIDENLFRTQRRMRLVNFNSNQLEMLPKRLFQNTLSLVTAFFNKNALSSLDEDLFETCTNLQLAYFISNRIESLPRKLFQSNLRLYIVHFQNNSITTIDENLFIRNEQLYAAYFDNNRLERLERNTFKETASLAELDLSNNQITNIDIDFGTLKESIFIDLRHNRCIDAVYRKDYVSESPRNGIFANLVDFNIHVIANCITAPT